VPAGPAQPEPFPTDRYRGLTGRSIEPWVRRIGLAALLAFVVTALLNVFGQHPKTSTASGSAASLAVESPKSLRGGLIFQTRFEVRAFRELREPSLVLDRGWFEGLTLNTTVPDPKDERTDNGRVVLDYDTIPAGRSLVVWLQFQVNPTKVGEQDQDVELYDGTTRLVRLDRSLSTFP
jgi:hypothetical protein